jgi:hypothetical protein
MKIVISKMCPWTFVCEVAAEWWIAQPLRIVTGMQLCG